MAGSFLDMQAHVGIIKHIGGLPATRTLFSLCHVEEAQEILEVGCGIGVGSVRAAMMYDCRVVGVDISERMIEWSRQRAREETVEDRIEFQVAGVLALPFEAFLRSEPRCWSGRRDSNPRHSAWEADTLPTELLPPGRPRF